MRAANTRCGKLQEIGLPVGTHAGTGTKENLSTKLNRMGMGPGVVDSKIVMPLQAMWRTQLLIALARSGAVR